MRKLEREVLHPFPQSGVLSQPLCRCQTEGLSEPFAAGLILHDVFAFCDTQEQTHFYKVVNNVRTHADIEILL